MKMKLNKTIKTTMSLAAAMGSLVLAGGSANAANVVGLWEFDGASSLTATIGSDLALTGSETAVDGIDGPGGSDGAYSVANGSHYTVAHGMAANGPGGTRVNAYSLVWDVQLTAVNGYNALWSHANEGDASLFVKGGGTVGFGQLGGDNYSSNTLGIDTWYRVVQTYDGGTSEGKLYVDGTLWATFAQQNVDVSRFSLAVGGDVDWFEDNASEELLTNVSNLALYDGALSAADVLALGSAGAAIPAGAAVPEPTTTALLGLGGLALILRRRK